MALSNLFEWNEKKESASAASCGSACGAGDRSAEVPTACGAADKPAEKSDEKPAACGSACGAGDK